MVSKSFMVEWMEMRKKGVVRKKTVTGWLVLGSV
jgi:hypothetical protein